MTNAEITGIIIGIAGLIIAYVALKKDHYSKPKSELENLKLHFHMTKTLSEKVQQQIQGYIQQHNAADRLIFEGVTFGKYLQLMQDNYSESFNDKILDFFDSEELTKPMIESMTQSLQQQFTGLQQMENKMKMLV